MVNVRNPRKFGESYRNYEKNLKKFGEKFYEILRIILENSE